MTTPSYDLHTIGWKAFQDLCIAVAEECLKRPVQVFLPSNDAGRDGAFVGRWDRDDEHGGSSVIQCKFTSLPHEHLSLSLLEEELPKAASLAARGLANDYVILTNHPVSGAAEIKIKEAFVLAGVGECRIFGRDWIVGQIRKSARLRMMVPRLYGLGDLSNILDGRAYEQASMILSALGEDLRRLVVTDAHRKSVKALTEHNFVLLLGAPAAGKSTIGASLAVGAADLWQSLTIRATSPADVKEHLNPHERQFFWVDDAWGSTQYRRDTIEAWNQILPMMQSAIQRGTQFLLTSRDYIWKAAQHDLKTQAFPLLDRSQVIINVHALSPSERAQILYNHLRLGDQPRAFRSAIKPILPKVAENDHFLPETARRLGSTFFTPRLETTEEVILDYFERPAAFLLETIRNLASDCRAAIALVFLSGRRVPSPVPDGDELTLASSAFGVHQAGIKDALNYLNGSLLLLAHDEQGRYWTYKHPTIGDCFAQLVANDPELTQIYLRGAKPELILREVVCAGTMLTGAPVCVPHHLYALLIERIADQPDYLLSGFISYRADRRFAELLLNRVPTLLDRLHTFNAPVGEDMDAALLARLHEFKLLPEEIRGKFVETVGRLAVEEADASFLKDPALRAVFSDDEIDSILHAVERDVLDEIPKHVRRLHRAWQSDYEPNAYFESFKDAVKTFVDEITWGTSGSVFHRLDRAVDDVVEEMEAEYEPPETVSTPRMPKATSDSPLALVFRDVDE
jgi:hypothetical protein